MNQLSNLDLATTAALHLEMGERELSRGISLPAQSVTSALRESAGEALISLGKRIKPSAADQPGTPKTALKPQWQGR